MHLITDRASSKAAPTATQPGASCLAPTQQTKTKAACPKTSRKPKNGGPKLGRVFFAQRRRRPGLSAFRIATLPCPHIPPNKTHSRSQEPRKALEEVRGVVGPVVASWPRTQLVRGEATTLLLSLLPFSLPCRRPRQPSNPHTDPRNHARRTKAGLTHVQYTQL